jgi:hypothetical protein
LTDVNFKVASWRPASTAGWQRRREVANGASIFDFPLADKIIVRQGRPWLSAGAHRHGGPGPVVERALGVDQFSVAHLPMPGPRRLEMRITQARDLIQIGVPEGFGWQSAALADAIDRGDVEAFWARHSVPAEGTPLVRGGRDTSLTLALRPLVDELTEAGVFTESGPTSKIDATPFLTMDRILRAMHDLLFEVDDLSRSLERDRDRLAGESAEAQRELAEMRGDRDAILRSVSWRLGQLMVGLGRRRPLAAPHEND